MKKLPLKKNNEWWWLILEGLMLISLGIILFKYPEEILTAIAYWFGIFVILAGAIGIIFWFFRKSEKKLLHLVISIAIIITGILMTTKIITTITVVTTVFGLLAIIVSIVLIRTGWNQRKTTQVWILPALFGVAAFIMNVKGIWDTFPNPSIISHFIGKSVLVAGIGLIMLAFLRMITRDKPGKIKSRVV